MNKFFPFIILLFLFQNTQSQNFVDLANASYAISPNNYWSLDGDASLSVASLNAKLPIKRENGDLAIFGLNGSTFKISSSNNDFEYPLIYSSTLLFGYTKKLNSKSQLLLMALPKISSDLEDVSKNDFQLGGIALFTFTKSEKFKYKFGLYYNQEYWGSFLVPIIGFDWQPNDKLQAFGNLPINATLMYKLNNKFSAGLFFQAPAGSFRMNENFTVPENSIMDTENIKFPNAYIHKTTQEISLFLDYYITRNIVLNLKCGATIGRSYRVFAEDDKLDFKIAAFNFGEERIQLNKDFSDGLIFELNFIYRLHFADL